MWKLQSRRGPSLPMRSQVRRNQSLRGLSSLSAGLASKSVSVSPSTLVTLDAIEVERLYKDIEQKDVHLSTQFESSFSVRAADYPQMLVLSETPVVVPFCIGISGGADSQSSCLWLHEECVRVNASGSLAKQQFPFSLRPILFSVVAITVDHNLRAESQEEAQYVSQVQASRGIACISACVFWNGVKKAVSEDTVICEYENIAPSATAARNVRYNQFLRVCRHFHKFSSVFQQGNTEWLPFAPFLVLGHHLNDQEETVMLRLLKDSGIAGLTGMHAVVPLQALHNDTNMNITYRQEILEPVGMAHIKTGVRTNPAPAFFALRPLLNVPKETFLLDLKRRALPWIEDPSNQKQKSERVRVRRQQHRLRVSFGPQFVSRSVSEQQRLAAKWDLEQNAFLRSECVYSSLGVATLKFHADHPLMTYALCRVLTVVADKGQQLNIDKCIALVNHISAQLQKPEKDRDILSSSSCDVIVLGDSANAWIEVYMKASYHTIHTPCISAGLAIASIGTGTSATKTKLSSVRKLPQYESIERSTHRSHLDAKIGVYIAPDAITTMQVRPQYAYRWKWW